MASKQEKAKAKVEKWIGQRYKYWQIAEWTSVSVSVLNGLAKRNRGISDETAQKIIDAKVKP